MGLDCFQPRGLLLPLPFIRFTTETLEILIASGYPTGVDKVVRFILLLHPRRRFVYFGVIAQSDCGLGGTAVSRKFSVEHGAAVDDKYCNRKVRPRSRSAMSTCLREPCRPLAQGRSRVRNLTVIIYLSAKATIGERNWEALIVNVQSNVCDRLFHNPRLCKRISTHRSTTPYYVPPHLLRSSTFKQF